MSIQGLVNIKKALSTLNPSNVRTLSQRPVQVALYAADAAAYNRLESFLTTGLSPARREESLISLTRGPEAAGAVRHDIAIYDEGIAPPAHAFVFESARPQRVITQILDAHEDLGVPLSRTFSPFRQPFVDRVIKKASRDNMLFSLATALPDIIPSFIELPWAVAEFASDSAFLTMNQIHMAFLIAGASDREVGYTDQKPEVAGIIASAFGWRAISRQIVGKIPFGGGLIPKAAIAYAGTRLAGLSLDRLYGLGYKYTRHEREAIYANSFTQGKVAAIRVLRQFRPDLAKHLEAFGDHKVAGSTVEAEASSAK